KKIRYTTSNTATYADKFGRHSVRALVGQEAMLNTYDYLGVSSPDVDPAIPYPTTSTGEKDSGTYGYSQYSMLSFFGVLDYNDNNTFFLSASLRADGSSLFGSSNRWGVFWSVSGSYNIVKEPFMAAVRDWMSQLKLRVSYGVNGNNNISAYRAYGVYATTEYNGANGMITSRPANPNLSWEKNKTWNVGLDFGFLDNRISGSVDFYNRITTDMLLDKSVPYTTGFGSNFLNTGSLRNRGVEIQLDATPVQTRDVLWTVGGNIAFNRTKVLDLAGSGFLETTDSRNGQSTAVRIVEGMNLYNYYIRRYAGVNPSNGDGLFWTEDGTLTNDRTKGGYFYAGSPEPKFTGGFNTSVSWKGFNLSAYFEYVYGNKVMTGNWYITDGEDVLSQNSQASALNYWKQPGDVDVYPRPIAGGSNVWYAGYSTRFLEDGSYMRIRDITLSYNLPEKVCKAIRTSGIKVYVSALNPYTFHHVNAFDPELGPLGYAYGGNHTMVKSFIGGLEVSF
ncbi:MAG: SusC/RagA family TonB-linked outer membrane protein, partial [Bacteroidales bacterium]|nr:SusC/RagA family TonB-linked outer membrane protein [Bacteroidales bacterium]